MIDVRTAINAAVAYLRDLYPSTPHDRVRLEEVEFSEKTGEWAVTLSYLDLADSALAGLTSGGYERRYKILRIEAGSGRVKSMRIRTADHA